jgi:hypothetical protein
MKANRMLAPVLAALLAVPLFTRAPAPALAGPDLAPPDVLEAWLPPECAGYVKLQGLGQALDSFLDSKARKDLESIPLVQFLLAQDAWQKFQAGLADFQTDGGMDPLRAFHDLFGQEVVISLSPQDGGVLLLTRAAGEKELEGALQAIRKAAGRKIGFNLEGYKTSHGERSIETIGEASFVSVGRVFALGNRMPSLERVIDLAEGKAKGSLKDSPMFARSSRSGGKEALVSLVMRPRELPNFSLPAKLDNPLASLILGGLAGALEASEVVTGALRIDGGSVDLEFSSFGKKADEKYGAFFPSAGAGPLAAQHENPGHIALWELHRDLKKWWDQRDELLDAHASSDLGNFNQIMSIVFGGRSFQDEILPKIGSTITLVARNQEYKDLSGRPKPAIPGFAGLFELKEAKELPSTLVSGFQTMIGIINNEQAKKEPGSNATFLLKTEKVGDVEVQVAAINLPKDAKPEITANFSPSLAVVGSRLVISSSAELARSLIEELKGSKTAEATAAAATGRAQDVLRIDSAPLASIISENLSLIIEDNIKKKGISTQQATGEMKAVLVILSRLRDFSVETGKDGDQVRMKMKLRHSLGESGAAAKSEEKKPVSL